MSYIYTHINQDKKYRDLLYPKVIHYLTSHQVKQNLCLLKEKTVHPPSSLSFLFL